MSDSSSLSRSRPHDGDALRHWRRRDTQGFTLVELLFVAGLIAVIAGVSMPQFRVGVERGRARAAARYLAGQMALARTEAVGRAASVALRIHESPQGVTLAVYVDGNRNGVRAREIDALVDRLIQPAVRLDDLFPGVVIGAPADAAEAPVVIGGSEILSFTSAGTATSGTIYILGRDGSRFAVRILGVTGRVRVLRYDPQSRLWVESL